ncbi:hypothetical protein DSL72_008212 [Monilinia vaccinii-corymbosi]|uniref:YTH domain-containing protein n=1 Tax=Monilinia vaccinii-corymbosi TaxID=61207 RepID=A0A8A3PJ62_9HELO|nr:hypothetical protein DSL72_008212 [Monilinia vaccinii-corymbosi]
MGDSPAVGSKSNDGGFPNTSQIPLQNSAQNLISTSSNYAPNLAYSRQLMSHATLESFNMTTLGASLPDMSYQSYGQRFPQSPSAPQPFMYQMQFANQGILSPPSTVPSSYATPYQTQYGVYSSSQQMQQQHMHMAANNPQFYMGQGYMGQPQLQQTGSHHYIQPGGFGQQGQIYTGNPTGVPYPQRGSFSSDNRPMSQHRNDLFPHVTGQAGRPHSAASSQTQSSVVRGPPRKPRQTGHAIWIGNLPPQTDLMSLVLHVCKEAVGLESLFLISKSNCAFANFKDEPACVAAQLKIHDSRFHAVRLVSRLRRASVGPAGDVAAAPTGPAASTPPQPAQIPSPVSENEKASQEANEKPHDPEGESSPPSKDRFFVVKSLTVEDLELSVRNGIWATQKHNEEALNKAYHVSAAGFHPRLMINILTNGGAGGGQAAENVYLIFSANKSGEYFGYARMISPINDDPAAAIAFAPQAHTVEDPDLPRAIPTPASEFAPRGRIIDDSARGTIFWEIDGGDTEEADEDDEDEGSQSARSDAGDAPSKAWGKPFKVEWVSTTRLPFYRTRGLRNPWNSNREVKIARDGTELESSIGKRLVGLFHRVPGPPVQMMPLGGFAAMRPYN